MREANAYKLSNECKPDPTTPKCGHFDWSGERYTVYVFVNRRPDETLHLCLDCLNRVVEGADRVKIYK